MISKVKILRLSSSKTLLFILTILLFRCSATKEAALSNETKTKFNQKPNSSKISNQVQDIVNKIEVIKATLKDNNEHELSMLSNDLVRVDNDGNIQCYIYLDDFTDENINELKSNISQTEITNEAAKVVQAWIAHEKVVEIAKFNFVKRITPPEYGKTLSPKDN